MSYRSTDDIDPCVRVYGTRVHNLRGVDVVAPRDALVAFTGISGSGKSSLAFGTIYAEAQRRYFESVAPYARRLLLPTGAPKVDDITGLPPAVALQQRRGSATSRSTVGTVTTLSNLLRMLFSRYRTTGLRRVLPEHRGWGMPRVPRLGTNPSGDRRDTGT
jgi:excinuclease ABC subunit A